MKGKSRAGEINGNAKKVRAAYPMTVAAKKTRDMRTVNNVSKIVDNLFANDSFKHPSKIPDVKVRAGKK
jgi:hypothetical protein